MVSLVSNHIPPYIVKVQACGFLKLIPSLIMAFFVALINHLTLWPQFGHLYRGDTTLPTCFSVWLELGKGVKLF